MGQRQRRLPRGAVRAQIGQGQRAARVAEFAGQHPGQVALIEVIEPGPRQLLQRGGQARMAEARARRRGASVDQKSLGEARHIGQLGGLGGHAGGLALRDRHAHAGIVDGIRQQPRERQAPAQRVARPGQRRLPAGHRASHGVGRHAATRGNGLEAGLPIARDGGIARRRAAGVERARRLAGPGDQPEAVAADAIHMGIDHGDGGGGRDHRLDGVAALAQHGQRALRRQRVRRHGHAPASPDRIEMKCHAPRLLRFMYT
ncbi:hypothetical protein D3C87_1100050 [compost metagenome]